jgi:hypothetical protein
MRAVKENCLVMEESRCVAVLYVVGELATAIRPKTPSDCIWKIGELMYSLSKEGFGRRRGGELYYAQVVGRRRVTSCPDALRSNHSRMSQTDWLRNLLVPQEHVDRDLAYGCCLAEKLTGLAGLGRSTWPN